jgi:hypothetical protein
MKKTDLHQMLFEELNKALNEAELSTGNNKFKIKVDVNKNPTKKGIKIQLIPLDDTILNVPDERISVNEKVQSAMNKALSQYNLQVNIDPDIRQATDDPNVLGYYIPLSQIRNLILNALKGDF